MNKQSLSEKIKQEALRLGFDACGFCPSQWVGEEETARVRNWLEKQYNADMQYMANHFDKRCNPTVLVEGSKSIISVALNYYPRKFQDESHPQFAYYAYGKDYHDIVKAKLQILFDYIKELVPETNGRVFTDTAPILERFWAAQAGLGFIGKNSLLIIPKKGSFFFLGEIILDLELEYDSPLTLSCGNCTRCMDACPSKAIVAPKIIDARRCISYQTIENKGEIDPHVKMVMNNRFYGCDICQQVCPWNRYARPHQTEEFNPSDEFLSLDYQDINNLSVESYQRIFKGSAIKRAKHSGLMRNSKAISSFYNTKTED